MEEFNELIKALQDYYLNQGSLEAVNQKLLRLINTIANEVDKEHQVEVSEETDEDKLAHLVINKKGSEQGHVIAKGLGKNLNLLYHRDKLTEADQYDNLLITNYVEWFWIKDHQMQRSDHIATFKQIKSHPGHIPELAKILSVHQLISEFCGQE